MKATGIVRRLDDLGRLVIPKEIRKQYRLKEGDSIEFFTENDRILIQKFDVMSKNIEEICIMCETLQAMYQNTVLFIQEEWLQRNQYHLQGLRMFIAYVILKVNRFFKIWISYIRGLFIRLLPMGIGMEHLWSYWRKER